MTAFRVNGGRVFYVEHECTGTSSGTTKQAHMQGGKVRNNAYLVQMFYVGPAPTGEIINVADPEDFEYTTDLMQFADKHSSGYTNCPLCGSAGTIKVDDEGKVSIREEAMVPISG
jgi:hypothetical protein